MAEDGFTDAVERLSQSTFDLDPQQKQSMTSLVTDQDCLLLLTCALN